MDLRNTPTGKGLAAIYRQEIIQDVTLFTFQSAAMFYDKLFSSLDFTLPGAATGRRGFPKEAMVCAFIVIKCEGVSQITDLADYLDNNRLIAHYSRVGGLYMLCLLCCLHHDLCDQGFQPSVQTFHQQCQQGRCQHQKNVCLLSLKQPRTDLLPSISDRKRASHL